MSRSVENRIRVFDLFGGIGGFRLGMRAVSDSFEFVDYVELEESAVESYNSIFGEEYESRNIKNIESEKIENHEILCAGFPCQPFSSAGNREGFESDKGDLFFEIERVVREKLPKVLFLENVKGLLNHSNGATFRKILKKLDEMGYDAEWQIVNSKYFGVPQNRERVFIIAYIRGECEPGVFPVGEEKGASEKENKCGDKGLVTVHPNIAEIGQANRIYSSSGVSPTLNKSWKPKIVEESVEDDLSKLSEIRKLTPREFWRLQGFPDWAFNRAKKVNNKSNLYSQAGNSVTVDVVEKITESLLNQVNF